MLYNHPIINQWKVGIATSLDIFEEDYGSVTHIGQYETFEDTKAYIKKRLQSEGDWDKSKIFVGEMVIASRHIHITNAGDIDALRESRVRFRLYQHNQMILDSFSLDEVEVEMRVQIGLGGNKTDFKIFKSITFEMELDQENK